MNEKLSKLEETILHVIKRASDKGLKLSKFQLLKIIYLIQVESQKYTEHSFIDDLKFYREKNGPVSASVYNAANNLSASGLIKIKRVENKEYGYPKYEHTFVKDSNHENLSDAELIFLNSVLEDWLSLSQAQLKKLVYETEPMEEILEKEKGKWVLEGAPLNLNSVSLDPEIIKGVVSE